MGRLFSQIFLLVKKNFVLQYRRPIGALVEVLLPCVLLGLIALTRLAIPVEDNCFSFFEPLRIDKFDKNYESLSLIGMAPDNSYVRYIAERMLESKDYLGANYTLAELTAQQATDLFSQVSGETNPTAIIAAFATAGLSFKNIVLFPDVESLQEILEQSSEFFSAAAEFTDDLTSDITYTLRMQPSMGRRQKRWYTELQYPYYFEPGPTIFRGYNQGWVALQQIIDRAILMKEGVEDVPVMSIRQMPYPAWTEDGFSNAVRNSLPLILVLSFMWIAASISKELVGEKCSRMKETMKMMGLSNWVLWLSWIIQRVILMAIAVFLMVVVLKATNYLQASGPVIVYFYLLMYALSVMTFCFFLSTLFTKTTTAIAGTMLGFFVLYIPYFFLSNQFDEMSNSSRYAACLLSSTCMAFGANVISKWETMNEGLQFSNVAKQTSDLDLFTMADVFLMLFVDIILYSLITWYVEAVFPGEYGIKQKPWFFLTRTYWFGANPKQQQDKENGIHLNELDQGNNEVHEKGPRDKAVGIAISGLVKRFQTPSGKVTAVNGLSLDMYEDQITSLLGHNGAGKTTTMSMLTGLFSPSDGDAYINGYSILTQMNKVRESLGICPQHNVLFDRLTVMEHLEFFIQLKGFAGDIKAEAMNMIKMLKLTDKQDAKSDQLSGGMKRKLSVGIALAGGSRVVILDEPTAGMDPYARRATWDLILENKKDRTILLTTHYMDEADFLGDRVAIMAAGKLICSGSSMFLKKKYGVGYNLTLVKGPGCQPQAVDTFIKSSVGTAEKISDVGSELIYVLPDEEAPNFIPLFKKLEDGKTDDNVNVESFGLSLTTLEEVFMKVGEVAEEKNGEVIEEPEKKEENLGGNVTQFKVFKPEELNSGVTLLFQQLKAMIIKRSINSMRYKKAIIVQLILPLVLAALGLVIVATTKADNAAEPLRAMDLSEYPGQGVVGNVFLADFSNDNLFSGSDTETYLNKMNLNIIDLLPNITTAKENYPKQTDCCTEVALTLNETCAARGGVVDNWSDCVTDDSVWGYKACYEDCLPAAVTCDADVPVPDAKYLEDDLSYFVNVFLAQNDDDPRFYRKNQVAYTYSTVTPSIVNLVYNGTGTNVDGYDENTADFSLGTSSNDSSGQQVVTGWFSHEGLHLAPGVQNVLSNMLLINKGLSKRIYVNNHPLPQSLLDRFSSAGANVEGSTLSIMMLLGFSFLVPSFVLFIVEERENKSKHLQQISGVNGVVYWFGTIIWDMVNYTVCVIVLIILFLVFQIEGYDVVSVLLLLLMYGFAGIPFVYFFSLPFSSPVSAFSIIAVFSFIVGLAGFIASLVLTFLGDDFATTLQWILIFLPNYNFIQGLSNIYANGLQKELYQLCVEAFGAARCEASGFSTTDMYSLGDGYNVGKQLLALFIIGVICFSLVLINELYGKTLRLMFDFTAVSSVAPSENPVGEDDDVARERTRVMCDLNSLSENSAVAFTNLRKCYGSKTAVQNITLGIPKNECFGLLGVNGAGKTTTFSMLTGDITMTAGDAFIAGYNLRTDIRKIQQRIGYCPQFDALIGIMTGRELLRMFANMRGIPSGEIEQTVNEAITNLNLDKWADKLCGSYSGGNKRKLSTAVALVGNPEVLFLDEPTAGMDPTARRFLWTVLADLTTSNIGTSIVLTTHSMEECEALCNRLVIMVNGAFRCLGSIQHLKSKYGDGYTITLTMEEKMQEECSDFILETFPGAVCKEAHLGYLNYQLGSTFKWSYIFEKMEANKDRLQIEDYGVNQTSLEQVFLNFAKDQQEEDQGQAPKKSGGCFTCFSKPKRKESQEEEIGSRLEAKHSLRRRSSNHPEQKV